MLEQNGISVETLDLFELFGWIDAMSDDDAAVQAKLNEIQEYVETLDAPESSLMKMAKFGGSGGRRWSWSSACLPG
jgi:L-fucose isomerase-like protein